MGFIPINIEIMKLQKISDLCNRFAGIGNPHSNLCESERLLGKKKQKIFAAFADERKICCEATD